MAVKEIEASNYSVYIGNEALARLQRLLSSGEFKEARKFLLVDENTLKNCLPQLVAEVDGLKDAEVIEIESGEENKNIEICTQIWMVLSEMEADRTSLLINLGGGVIGDMGGFIASTYKRGIRFINIPTTLLSQVDASVGGKVGIDLNLLKNQVGVFNNPQAVFIYPPFLKTLNKDQLLSGFAEVVKHALIQDAAYWEDIQQLDISKIESFANLIQRSVEIKNNIVNQDPYESSLRKALNFGHTIGHAVESYSLEGENKALLHGEAVAVGMICEAYLSYRKKWLKEEELQAITNFLLGIFPAFVLNEMTFHRLIELMRNDKKNQGNTINFTLLKGIGHAVVDQTCNATEIIDALNYYREAINELTPDAL